MRLVLCVVVVVDMWGAAVPAWVVLGLVYSGLALFGHHPNHHFHGIDLAFYGYMCFVCV